ncbi:MAG TPA: hypothetical protein PKU69_05380, partial [Bacillota bacterium]|nr:hypothetical protein [Bacillota bacterium]
IERIISKDNKNIVRINNQVSSIKVLKDLAVHLADIHSQFDTNRLINPENYLSLVDNFRKDKLMIYLAEYRQTLQNYQSAIHTYKMLVKDKEQTLKQLDLYQSQYNELEALHLEKDEEKSLEEQVNLMENLDKINTVLEKFDATMEEERVLDNIYMMKSDLDSIAKTSTDFNDLSIRMNDLYYELEDIRESLSDKKQTLDFDPQDYDQMITRLNTLEKIRRKYGKSIDELIDYQEYLDQEINKADNYDEIIKEQAEQVGIAYEALLKNAMLLRTFRKDLAKKITKEIKETLGDLVILNADFEIRFEDKMPKDAFDTGVFTEDGIDQVDFYISTNLGEPLKQLSKTASGGEMSRVMLAFKSIFVRSN